MIFSGNQSSNISFHAGNGWRLIPAYMMISQLFFVPSCLGG